MLQVECCVPPQAVIDCINWMWSTARLLTNQSNSHPATTGKDLYHACRGGFKRNSGFLQRNERGQHQTYEGKWRGLLRRMPTVCSCGLYNSVVHSAECSIDVESSVIRRFAALSVSCVGRITEGSIGSMRLMHQKAMCLSMSKRRVYCFALVSLLTF